MENRTSKGPPARAGRPRARKEPLGIKSVEQALDVIEALAQSDRARSLTELSRHTGMEPSKLHRYLVSLCARGMIKRVKDSGLYDLGPSALALGVASLSRLDDFDTLRESADKLSEQFRENSFVYVWTRTGPVLVHNRRPAYALVNLRIGSVVPLINSATGPVFLAYLDEAITRPILARDAKAEGVDLTAISRQLREHICPRIRADEVHWSDVTIVPNSAACASPVFDAQGDLIAVLGISFYTHGVKAAPQDKLRAAVQAEGRAATRALGYVARPTDREPRRGPEKVKTRS